jgi:hypothetical protein
MKLKKILIKKKLESIMLTLQTRNIDQEIDITT